MSDSERLLSRSEAAAYLGISDSTLHRLTKAGALPFVRVGKFVRFRREDIENYGKPEEPAEGTERNETND